MISAMWNGMSGITTFDRAISIESNNVTNANTIGHKSDTVTFEDMMYRNGYGKGVGLQSITKNFSQGEVNLTNVGLDVAIEGKGFFTVSERSTGDVYYTRAGNFQQGEDGLLETQEKMKILGLSPQQKNLITTDANDTMFTNEFSKVITSLDIKSPTSVSNVNVKTTDYTSSATDDLVNGSNYKTASSKINDVELLKNDYINKLKLLQSNHEALASSSVSQISQVDYSSLLGDLTDQNDYLSLTIDNKEYRQYFDTDLETTLNSLSDKLSNTEGFTSSIDTTSGILKIEGLVPGKEFNLSEANINAQYIPLLDLQDAVLGTGQGMLDSSRDALKKAVENAGAKYLEITNVLDFSDTSTIAADEINLRLNSLGLVENALGTIRITDDGLVYVTNENSSFLISKIQTAHFRNMQGLNPIGSNLFESSAESGGALNADNLNTLVSNSLENGNSSYSTTLSTLLFYQKSFEANSKSISVSDEFLQTAIGLKK